MTNRPNFGISEVGSESMMNPHARHIANTIQRLATAAAIDRLSEPECCRAAVELASGGFAVLPVAKKRPLITGGVHGATRCPVTIKGWWKRWPDADVAIAAGRSGLCVIDIDQPAGPDSLADLEGQHGRLPETLVVQTPSGGAHYYFSVPPNLNLRPSVGKLGPGVDVRAGPSYVVSPPSPRYFVDHPTIDLPTCKQIVSLPDWLIHHARADDTHKAHKAHYMFDGTASDGMTRGEAESLDDLPSNIQGIIDRTLPKAPGTRNRRIFDLVCAMKVDPELRAMSRADRKRILRKWYEQALPKIRTRDYAVTVADFDHAWKAYDSSRAGGNLADIVAAAKSSAPVNGVDPHYPDRVHLLARVCRELARRSEDSSFFLGARAIERHLGTPSMTASRDMKLLIADGLIKISKRAGFSNGRRRATHYVYHPSFESGKA